jgi:hypothetical protein
MKARSKSSSGAATVFLKRDEEPTVFRDRSPEIGTGDLAPITPQESAEIRCGRFHYKGPASTAVQVWRQYLLMKVVSAVVWTGLLVAAAWFGSGEDTVALVNALRLLGQ